MFRRIVIEVTAPICSCEEQDLLWNVPHDAMGPYLVLTCKTCGTALTVPRSKFMAIFKFDTPYPGKKESSVPQPTKLDVLEGGKVIQMKASAEGSVQNHEPILEGNK